MKASLELCVHAKRKVECFSHALPQTYPGNHMAGLGDKSCSAGKSWDTKLAHSLKAKGAWDGWPHLTRIPMDHLYCELVTGKRPTG